MDWFAIVKKHYKAGRYTDKNVAVFVVSQKITEAQYQEITGLVFGAVPTVFA
ncbi:XkdX family protein [Paenibacillus chungangensis]|uniref:XkdX family protein n=1 Tax=Paenibacillus chungangensis TaxID=696535 RepID=A0ABW3HQF1_9BACL